MIDFEFMYLKVSQKNIAFNSHRKKDRRMGEKVVALTFALQ